MSIKSLAFIFFCIAFLACASGNRNFGRPMRAPMVSLFQRAFVQRNNAPNGLAIEEIISRKGERAMIPCNESSCCPKHYHYCCESGTRCCDFTGRRLMTYSCY